MRLNSRGGAIPSIFEVLVMDMVMKLDIGWGNDKYESSILKRIGAGE